jgi:putative lipoic acid-binding regulatory protein
MAFDTLDVGTLDVFNPLVGGALVIPKGFWEPGTASIHKLHCGQGAMATPFAASLVVGPSATSPLSINTIGLEQLTGIRNCFGSDIKIGSNISLGALDISYNGVNSELNGIKAAAVPEWSTVAPKFDANAFTMDLKSPAGKLKGAWLYNGSTICAPCPSDQRSKTNVVNLENSLEKVLSLRGVSFSWNPDVVPGRAKKQDIAIGLIAQEVEKVIPEVVVREKIENEDLKTVEYGNLTAVLIEAIKEQQQQIEELKQRITDLEGNK